MGNVWDSIASTGDTLGGSTDEFVGRTFDDTEGGGAGDVSAWMDSVARAGDRAAGQFDEGAGGLITLFDSQAGNTAGSGQSEMWTPTEENIEETVNDVQNAADEVTPQWADWIANNQETVLLIVVVFVGLYLARPFAEIGANASGG